MPIYASPEEFIQLLDSGQFDGRLQAELEKLPHEFLAAVATLLAKRLHEGH
jgi:hypothetical protein